MYSEWVSECLKFQILYLAPPEIFNCFLCFRWHNIYFQIFLMQAAGCCIGPFEPQGSMRIYHLISVYLDLLFRVLISMLESESPPELLWLSLHSHPHCSWYSVYLREFLSQTQGCHCTCVLIMHLIHYYCIPSSMTSGYEPDS